MTTGYQSGDLSMKALRTLGVSAAILLGFLYDYGVNAAENNDKQEEAKAPEGANVKEDFKTLKQDAKQDSKEVGNDIKAGFKKIGGAFKKEDKK
ncbi:MAG: hypothetical protein R3268_00960 [Acidiferrobacterales bacterium]|nr:hypothetical protein [Acidiferrobacterales bacterium]